VRQGSHSLLVTFSNLVSAFHLPPPKIHTNPHCLKKTRIRKCRETKGSREGPWEWGRAGQGRAGQGRAGQEEKLLRQAWRALPTQADPVPAWELLQNPSAAPWDSKRPKPCDATGRDEARG